MVKQIKMYLVAIYILGILGNKSVIELPVNHINFTPGEYNEHIGIQNVVLKKNVLHMRAGKLEESLVRWDLKNTTEDWAFEIKVNNLHLSPEEHSELFLSYTDEKTQTGTFRGNNSIYNGMKVGLSFYGKAISIIYAPNDGKDYSGTLGDLYIKRDHIDPQRFRDVNNFIFKVICTGKNFKVEIYDDDKNKILYDNFRKYDTNVTKFNKPGKYFGIVAHYKNLASGKSFELKKASLYMRIEDKNYDVSKIESSVVPITYREVHEIEHYDSGIQKLIHHLEVSMLYIKNILGPLPETVLYTFENSIKKLMDNSNEKIKKIDERVARFKKMKSSILNLNDFEVKIQKIQRNIRDMAYFTKNNSQYNTIFIVKEFIFGIGCIILYIVISDLFSLIHKRNQLKNK